MSVSGDAPARRTPISRRIQTVMPYVLLAVMVGVLLALPLLTGPSATAFNVYDALQLWSAYGLVTLGVGLTMIAGEFDFGVLGVFAFCPMIAVKIGEYDATLGLALALGFAALIGFLQGVIVAKLRLHSMPVTLGFYIALLGATMTIGHSQSVSFSNFDLGMALDAQKLQILSWRSLIAIAVFAFIRAWEEYIFVRTLLIENKNWVMSLYLFWVSDDIMGVDYGIVAAVSVFYVLPSLLLYVFCQKYLTQMTIGGIRG